MTLITAQREAANVDSWTHLSLIVWGAERSRIIGGGTSQSLSLIPHKWNWQVLLLHVQQTSGKSSWRQLSVHFKTSPSADVGPCRSPLTVLYLRLPSQRLSTLLFSLRFGFFQLFYWQKDTFAPANLQRMTTTTRKKAHLGLQKGKFECFAFSLGGLNLEEEAHFLNTFPPTWETEGNDLTLQCSFAPALPQEVSWFRDGEHSKSWPSTEVWTVKTGALTLYTLFRHPALSFKHRGDKDRRPHDRHHLEGSAQGAWRFLHCPSENLEWSGAHCLHLYKRWEWSAKGTSAMSMLLLTRVALLKRL